MGCSSLGSLFEKLPYSVAETDWPRQPSGIRPRCGGFLFSLYDEEANETVMFACFFTGEYYCSVPCELSWIFEIWREF